MQLRDLIGSNPSLVLAGEELGEADSFSCLGSCVSPRGRIPGEDFEHIEGSTGTPIWGIRVVSDHPSEVGYIWQQ